MSQAHYIFTSGPSMEGLIQIEGEEAAHLMNSLRVRPGDRFTAFDGKGRYWSSEVARVERSKLAATIVESFTEPFPVPALTVAVGVVKAARMDWAVEKAAELGAVRFIPLETEFNIVEPGFGKLRRWKGIALAAAKQSRHAWLMEVTEPLRPEILPLELLKSSLLLDMADDAKPISSLQPKLAGLESITILIGPEGGWSPKETEFFREHGALPVSLGCHPLRTESAVAVALGVVNTLLGAA
jgi:16S rRNA (uracil1498-N3)-methyltransferase